MKSKLFETTEFTAAFSKLAENKDYRQLVYVVERMYGTGGFGNSLAFCTAIEGACGTMVPPRAQYIRTILMELSMMQEKFIRLAAIAENLGYDRLSMMCWAEREYVLNILDNLAGNRMLLSMCCVGGVRRDLSEHDLEKTEEQLDIIIEKTEEIKNIFANDKFVCSKLKGVGYISKEDAEVSSVTGVAAKGSGVAVDRRSLGEYGVYNQLDYEIITEDGCDCHARCMVNVREIIQSAQLVKATIDKIPTGNIVGEMPKVIDGEWIAKVEQADGADTYYVKGTGSAYLEAVGVRRAGESNEKVMYRAKDYTLDEESLVRLTLGIDDCLKER